MAAFNFPDPTIQQTVTNPITGSTYQWKEPPGKWVITTKVRAVSDIIYEGDTPPIPRGDYKLWYSTDTLELYFWYEDENGVGAWVPTSAPITMIEDLDSAVFELRRDLTATNVAVKENENQIGRTIYFGDTAPTIYPDEVIDGATYRNELNYKFWYDDSRFELLILFRDANGNDSYVPVSTSPKGEVLKYTVDNNIGTLVTTPGKISSNSGFWSSVNKFSFGTEDADGITTPTMSDGQTIETYSPEENKTNLYKITNASGAPTEVEVNYISGDLFYVPDLELDVYIRDELVDYVKKTGGDTMEGPLQITGPRKAGDDADNPDLVSSLQVLSIDNAQNSGLHLRHSGTTKLYVGDNDLSVAADIKFNRGAGTRIKTNQQDIFNIGLNEVAYLGETIEDEDLVTKKYVDDADEVLRQDIIELEEEIEAIAPSVERGSWNFTLSGTVSGPGVFTAYDQYVATSGNPIGLVTNIKSIWFHSIDNAGTPHGFDNVEPGNLLQLFVEGKEEYGLFEVVEVHDFTGGASDYWVIDVDFVRTLENTTRFDNNETCRLNIFKAPEGGTADGFVLKTGDTMTGDLDIDRSTESTNVEAALALTGSRPNTTNSAATIAFENSQSATLGYLTYRSFGNESFFKFNRDVDLNNKVLRQIGEIRMTPGGSIGAGSNQRLTFNNANSGNEATGLLVVPRPVDNRRSFVIRGNDADGNEQDMFYTYSNVSGTPDAVNYVGKMDGDNNLVNKSYVDDKMAELLAKIEELEMTSGTTESYSIPNE